MQKWRIWSSHLKSIIKNICRSSSPSNNLLFPSHPHTWVVSLTLKSSAEICLNSWTKVATKAARRISVAASAARHPARSTRSDSTCRLWRSKWSSLTSTMYTINQTVSTNRQHQRMKLRSRHTRWLVTCISPYDNPTWMWQKYIFSYF